MVELTLIVQITVRKRGCHQGIEGFRREIGDHLGHQSPEATRIYAKVDLAALRMVGDFALEGLL